MHLVAFGIALLAGSAEAMTVVDTDLSTDVVTEDLGTVSVFTTINGETPVISGSFFGPCSFGCPFSGESDDYGFVLTTTATISGTWDIVDPDDGANIGLFAGPVASPSTLLAEVFPGPVAASPAPSRRGTSSGPSRPAPTSCGSPPAARPQPARSPAIPTP